MSGYGSPTGFVAFQQYLDANQGTAEQMAQKAGDAAVMPGTQTLGAAFDTQRNVGMLGNAAGQQAMLQKGMGKQAHVTGFDAALAGAAGGNYFQQLQQQYGQAGNQMLAQQKQTADLKRKAANAPKQVTPTVDPNAARLAAAKQQADAFRQEDAKRPSGQMGRERWANLHGMTLEQWVERGQQPPF